MAQAFGLQRIRTAWIMCDASSYAEPTTPMPTGDPASSRSGARLGSDHRIMSSSGQQAMPWSIPPTLEISSSVKWMPWANHAVR